MREVENGDKKEDGSLYCVSSRNGDLFVGNSVEEEIPDWQTEVPSCKHIVLHGGRYDGEQAEVDPRIESLIAKTTLIRAHESGRLAIAWQEMYSRLGLGMFDLLPLAIDFDELSSAEETALSVLYKALTLQPLEQVELEEVHSSMVSSIIHICLDREVFLPQAEPGIRAASSKNANKNSLPKNVHRLLLALSLSRKHPQQGPVYFDQARFITFIKSNIPSVYHEEARSLAKSVDSLCAQGRIPHIAIKCADGSPAAAIAGALADALSEEGRGHVDIDIGSLTAPIDLAGLNVSFNEATPGILASRLYQKSAPVVLYHAEALGNLCSSSGDGNAQSFVRALLETGFATDAYMGFPMKVSEPIIVCESNTNSKDSLSSSCDITLSIHTLNRKEKITAANEILSSLEIHYEKSLLPEWLVDHYAFDDGIALLQTACLNLKNIRGTATVSAAQSMLPAPNRKDPRQWVASRRADLERCDFSIMTMADELLQRILEDPDDKRSISRLKMLLSLVPNGTRLHCPSRSGLIETIQRTHPGILEQDIEGMVSGVLASALSKHPRPLLLVGAAGIGKTTLVASLAAALEVPVYKVDAMGISIGELFGSPIAPSSISERLSAGGGSACVLHIDEIDKATSVNANSLLSFLDEGIFHDSYLNVPVDISRDLIILTANDLDDVNSYVVDRCDVLSLHGYDQFTKAEIAPYLAQNIASKFALRKAPRIDQEVFEYLAMLDDTAGVRQLEGRIEKLLVNYIGKDKDDAITIEDAKALFPRAKTFGLPGIKVIMRRGGSKGGAVCARVVTKAERGKEIECLASSSAYENAVKRASAAASILGATFTGKISLSSQEDIECSFAPHAALGTAIAFLLPQHSVTDELGSLAFMGSVSLSGSVELEPDDPGNAPFYIAAAKRNDIDVLICPKALADDRQAKRFAQSHEVLLVGVSSIRQALDFAKMRVELNELENELEKELF